MTRPADHIEITVCGIPAIAAVTEYRHFPGSFSSRAETPDDYHGYTDLEYEICDRRGRPAPWLERKLTDRQRMDLDEFVSGAMRRAAAEARADAAYDRMMERRIWA